MDTLNSNISGIKDVNEDHSIERLIDATVPQVLYYYQTEIGQLIRDVAIPEINIILSQITLSDLISSSSGIGKDKPCTL